MRMNKKKWLAVLGLMTGMIIFSALYYLASKEGSPSPAPSSATSTIKIATSFYPLAEFAKAVGQDKVTVTNLTPAGAEPHDFEPSPKDIINLQTSKLFIYNGAGLEPWADRILPELQQKAVVTVNASENIILLSASGQEKEDTGATPPPGGFRDPHVWLDPLLAVQEVTAIKNGLIKADKTNAAFYNQNAEIYIAKLKALHQLFQTGLQQCDRQEIVTSHAAFGYVAKEYGLTMVPISGLSPDEEPSPKRLTEISQFAQEHGIKYIFFETLISPRLAQTIAREVGAQTIAFNPLEGLTNKELDNGLNYISVQRQNLINLRIALGCH